MPAPEAGFQGLAGPRGTADDLKKLTGVSGAIEKKFNDLGIFHYWQLAELDHDTAHKIGEEVGLPARADGWVAQAKASDGGSRVTRRVIPEPASRFRTKSCRCDSQETIVRPSSRPHFPSLHFSR